MSEDVLFSTEERRSRGEVADYLRSIADKLDGDGSFTLAAGADSITLSVPDEATFEVEVERETGDGAPEYSLEFELEWRAENGTDGSDGAEFRVE